MHAALSVVIERREEAVAIKPTERDWELSKVLGAMEGAQEVMLSAAWTISTGSTLHRAASSCLSPVTCLEGWAPPACGRKSILRLAFVFSLSWSLTPGSWPEGAGGGLENRWTHGFEVLPSSSALSCPVQLLPVSPALHLIYFI